MCPTCGTGYFVKPLFCPECGRSLHSSSADDTSFGCAELIIGVLLLFLVLHFWLML